MSTEHEPAGTSPTERGQRTAKAVAIPRRPRRGRGPLGPRLTKGQIDAQRRDAMRRERAGDGAKHRRLAVGARTVGEHDTIARRETRPMKHPTHGALGITLLEQLEVRHDAGA